MKRGNDFIPIRRHEIEIGKPLKWSIFDQHHKLLMSAGQVVRSDQQLERLTVPGACRDSGQSYFSGTRTVDRPTVRARVETPAPAVKVEEPVAAPPPSASPPVAEASKKRGGFAELRLPIGTQVQMGEVDGETENFRVRYLGLFDGDSVLVTAPVLGNRALAPVREGQRFQLRAFQGKAVYVFEAAVLRVCMAPYPYLHLQYPQKVQIIGLREAERIRVELPTSVEIDGQEGNHPWRMVDVSVKGVQRVAEEGSANVEDTIAVTVNLPIADRAIDVRLCGIIRAVRPMVGGTAYGVQLTEVDDESLLLIQNFVYRQLLGL